MWLLNDETDDMYQLNLRIKVNPNQAERAVHALRSITISTQVERGFLASRIYQEAGNPEGICLEEDWSSEAELKSHIRSSCFTGVGGSLGARGTRPGIRGSSAVRGHVEKMRNIA